MNSSRSLRSQDTTPAKKLTLLKSETKTARQDLIRGRAAPGVNCCLPETPLCLQNPRVSDTARRMKLTFSTAAQADASELASLHTAVASDLTNRYGRGPWSFLTTEKGVLFGMRHALVLVTRKGKTIVGTLQLPTKKPWAIDVS